MAELLRWTLDDGGEVFVETASESLGSALAHVRDATSVVLAHFRDLDVRRDKIEAGFGVKLTAQAGAASSKTGLDGHLNVKLT